MKVKWGAIVVDGRNKIGGHVASKNRAGSYFRTKVTPVNPRSTFQVNVRNRLGGLSSAWRGLTAAQRIAWNAAVSDYKKTDIFGDIRNPSGFNLYQKLNNNLVNIVQSQLTAPPLPEAVNAFTSVLFEADNSSQVMHITYAPAIEADHSVLVFGTPAISPGISFVKSEFRQFDVINAADASPFEIGTEYIAKFGPIGAVGMQIFVQLVQVNWNTGQAGIPIQDSCIIVV
jgi:hypothetical protein